jgi:hypothetical protein
MLLLPKTDEGLEFISLQPKPGPRQISALLTVSSSSKIAKSFNVDSARNRELNRALLMLVTRSLPPQFLLPAWSARQLAQASQRAQKSTSTDNGHPKFRRLVRLKDKVAVQRPVITDSHIERELAASELQEAETQEPLSLFDELFPEESSRRRQREQVAEKRLDKLPAFNWNSQVDLKDRGDEERAKKREQYKSIPRRDGPVLEDASTAHRPISLDNPYEIEHLRNDLDQQPRGPVLPSVLVLNACSKTLEESDFFRLGPRGEHIEGWTSGIIKGTDFFWLLGLKTYI